MISVQEAQSLIKSTVRVLYPEQKNLSEAVGQVLSEDVVSPLALPPFRQSSMDGYALHHADVAQSGITLPVVAESRAGNDTPQVLERGTALHILTGAPVPDGATAVVMKEKVERNDNEAAIQQFPVSEGQNVRSIGQQIRKGDLAMPKNTYLTPGSVGFLAGMNIQNVKVYRRPSVGILVTGDELVLPGNVLPGNDLPGNGGLRFGQIFESSSSMLAAVLRAEGILEVEIRYVPDDEAATIAALRDLTENNDVVLSTGGVSVGDYDFVGTALEEIGVETVFYKVRQRPGKPLFFGRNDDTIIFALPGNPASTLVCYYEYVLPALRLLSGRSDCFLPKLKLPITHAFSFHGERDEFLKATATTEAVTPLDGQESFALRSFAIANALIYLPAGQNTVQPGDLVEAHLLPFFC
ncbi:molybdopterin molybdotransferase MoeA [Persicitalea jodogahamensis]|uniref:Molybdopterin molybdenumtransferase n=1 Tax=Persicitalea jodogahamensis TaxID=402147 RepID=A0A8J3D4W9_9BACT|nr:gephyrin-like molybdotransferase Glp [Persicitalea jodogahamensis]GHB73854.1 molybdopterin molybdenumtransferase MoeA [Persicitalea jodogahamensis]